MRTDVHAAAIAAALLGVPAAVYGQHAGHMPDSTMRSHAMWSATLPGGWRLMGMAQAYPIVTFGAPFRDDGPLRETGVYVTQTAAMTDLVSPGSRFVLRTTLDFEGFTQENGELNFGAWGEGFIDRRHPHTLLHELMLSINAWADAGGASLSVGRGFAAYGTEDPMGRPGIKYPTNHHLSQILERWTVTGAFAHGGWSIEASVFGGNEPEDPWDVWNLTPFGNSVSARLARRWGGVGAMAAWQASLSVASVREEHDDDAERTRLLNLAVRHANDGVYVLLEASHAEPESDASYFSILGETRIERGFHAPYVRLEYATRPEWERLGGAGSDDFFRYDHDAEPTGATRWLIATTGYGVHATGYPLSVQPFVEAQYHRVREERGGIDPAALFGRRAFWSLSLGARVYPGGGPMRMGAYGVVAPEHMRPPQ